jgi:hypothetical protein
MGVDSINDEILRIKRELAGRFDNDLARIVADAKSREHNAISLPPRPANAEPTNAGKRNRDASDEMSIPAARGSHCG